MALRTSQAGVSSAEREACLGVIERGGQPGGGRMAAAATGAELAAVRVILGVAGVAVG